MKFNNCLYVKGDLNDPNRVNRVQDGKTNSLNSEFFWELFPSRVQRPFLHADGYKSLLCTAARRCHKGANGATPIKEFNGVVPNVSLCRDGHLLLVTE